MTKTLMSPEAPEEEEEEEQVGDNTRYGSN